MRGEIMGRTIPEIEKRYFCVNEKCNFFKKPGSIVQAGYCGTAKRFKRLRCRECDKRFSETYGTIFKHKRTDPDKILLTLKALAEGNTIRGTGRITGFSNNTVMGWLHEAGEHCEKFEEELVPKFNFNQVQMDEMWTFVYKKTKAEAEKSTERKR